MKAKNPIKISDEGIAFLKKLKRNRIKTDSDMEGLSYWQLIEIIERYFKNHNDHYLELVKMEINKNVS